ncbi:MAG: cytochrome c [Gemmatimonadetes bacterium]|nr:cytochrome c [Gemmatimonadota bacterium]
MIRASRPALTWALALAISMLLGAAPLSAQAAADMRSVRDGVYTDAQSDRGEAAFRRNCASCHTLDEFTGLGFMRQWMDRPVFDLFDLVRNTMPQDFPGLLTARQYADIVAFFLKQNGLPAGESELPATRVSLAVIVIQPPPSR